MSRGPDGGTVELGGQQTRSGQACQRRHPPHRLTECKPPHSASSRHLTCYLPSKTACLPLPPEIETND